MYTTPDEWRKLGRIVRLLGHEIFVVDSDARELGTSNQPAEQGNYRLGEHARPTVFLIHGFPTSSWDWKDIWPLMREDFRLVAIDLLGFGFSAKPNPHEYHMHEQADLCEALIDELGLDAFHVLSHDYGDTVAQELLARQNELSGRGRWLSVCFLNGGLFPETHRARVIQKLLATPLGPLVNRFATKRTFDRSFSAVFGPNTQPTARQLDDFWNVVNYNDGKHIFHNLITYIADRREYRERWLEALRHSAVPICLINGSLDPVSGAHMVDRYQEIVGEPHTLVQLPHVGHYPQVEAPADVITAYRSFLKAQESESQ